MIGNKEKIQIALPFILIMISFIVGKTLYFKPLEPPLTPLEKKMLSFVPEKTGITEKTTAGITNVIASPFEISKKDFPAVPLSALTSDASQMKADTEKPVELKLTMIIISQKRRSMAIVNGLVLKEGDIISNMKLEKIERNRILLSNILMAKKTRWLYLEEK